MTVVVRNPYATTKAKTTTAGCSSSKSSNVSTSTPHRKPTTAKARVVTAVKQQQQRSAASTATTTKSATVVVASHLPAPPTGRRSSSKKLSLKQQVAQLKAQQKWKKQQLERTQQLLKEQKAQAKALKRQQKEAAVAAAAAAASHPTQQHVPTASGTSPPSGQNTTMPSTTGGVSQRTTATTYGSTTTPQTPVHQQQYYPHQPYQQQTQFSQQIYHPIYSAPNGTGMPLADPQRQRMQLWHYHNCPQQQQYEYAMYRQAQGWWCGQPAVYGWPPMPWYPHVAATYPSSNTTTATVAPSATVASHTTTGAFQSTPPAEPHAIAPATTAGGTPPVTAPPRSTAAVTSATAAGTDISPSPTDGSTTATTAVPVVPVAKTPAELTAELLDFCIISGLDDEPMRSAERLTPLLPAHLREHWTQLALLEQQSAASRRQTQPPPPRLGPLSSDTQCRCGSTTHRYVHDPACRLFPDTRSQWQRPKATQQQQKTDTINAVHKALVLQQQRNRADQTERRIEHDFIRRMQTLEWEQHGRAAAAPVSVTTMVVQLLWDDDVPAAQETHWCLALLDRIRQRWGHCFQEPSHAEYAWHRGTIEASQPRTPGAYTFAPIAASTAYAAIVTTGLTDAISHLCRQGIVDGATGQLTEEWWARLDAPLLEDGVVPKDVWQRTATGWVMGGSTEVYRHVEKDEFMEWFRRKAESKAGIGKFF